MRLSKFRIQLVKCTISIKKVSLCTGTRNEVLKYADSQHSLHDQTISTSDGNSSKPPQKIGTMKSIKYFSENVSKSA